MSDERPVNSSLNDCHRKRRGEHMRPGSELVALETLRAQVNEVLCYCKHCVSLCCSLLSRSHSGVKHVVHYAQAMHCLHQHTWQTVRCLRLTTSCMSCTHNERRRVSRRVLLDRYGFLRILVGASVSLVDPWRGVPQHGSSRRGGSTAYHATYHRAYDSVLALQCENAEKCASCPCARSFVCGVCRQDDHHALAVFYSIGIEWTQRRSNTVCLVGTNALLLFSLVVRVTRMVWLLFLFFNPYMWLPLPTVTQK